LTDRNPGNSRIPSEEKIRFNPQIMNRIILAFFLSVLSLRAQDVTPAANEAIHQQLRDTRTEIIAAIESRDVDRMLKLVHPDIVVTWQNGETCHGVDELRAFYERSGKNSFVGYKVPHQPDNLSILHGGDTAISSGFVVANYVLLGRDYEFTSRWTATLIQQDGKWLVAGYHVSLNALDNPILNTAKSALWIAGGIGLVIGGIVVFIMKRRR
jgi:ketosteroid isomerase-like protein